MRLQKSQIELLNRMVEEKMLYKRKHPVYDLWVYKYSHACKRNEVWNEITLMSRGLVLDADYNIIARPMRKFFNFDELPKDQIASIMTPPFQVTDKIDGSLGILVRYRNDYFIATQGSFDSDQAVWATNLLNTKYADKIRTLDTDNYTYMFEIVYPDNRIVVDYGSFADLVYITKVDMRTGFEPLLQDSVEIEMQPFRCVRRFKELEGYSHLQLKQLNTPNKEGFVVQSEAGRMKIKFDKYLELHHIVNRMSPTAVWKILKNNTQDETRESLPEEIRPWWDRQVALFTNKVEEQYTRLTSIINKMHDHLGCSYTENDFVKLNHLINNPSDAELIYALEKRQDDVKLNILLKLRPMPDTDERKAGNSDYGNLETGNAI